jgi:RimJ/RimL family protein N-acetyltransferase
LITHHEESIQEDFMGSYLLSGEKVSLRQIKEEDLILINEWHNDYDNKYAAMMHPFPVTMEQEADWMRTVISSGNNKNVLFAVVDNHTGQLLGYTGLTNINYVHRNCNPLTVIGVKDRLGQGIGTEVLQLIIKYAFQHLNLYKVTGHLIPSNIASKKHLERQGFVLEGTMHNHYFARNAYQDVLIMSVFNENYQV